MHTLYFFFSLSKFPPIVFVLIMTIKDGNENNVLLCTTISRVTITVVFSMSSFYSIFTLALITCTHTHTHTHISCSLCMCLACVYLFTKTIKVIIMIVIIIILSLVLCVLHELHVYHTSRAGEYRTATHFAMLKIYKKIHIKCMWIYRGSFQTVYVFCTWQKGCPTGKFNVATSILCDATIFSLLWSPICTRPSLTRMYGM